MASLKPQLMAITNADYDAIPALRSSHLKAFIKSPRHFQHALTSNELANKTSILTGLYVHTGVLQPEKLKDEYVFVKASTRATKEFKEVYAEMKRKGDNRHVLLESEKRNGDEIIASIQSDSYVMELINGSFTELSATAKLCDVWCKCRMDGYIPETGVVFDIKTTSEPIDWFGSVIRRFGYDTSAAYYIDVVNEATFGEGSDETNRPSQPLSRFIFIVVESKPPFGVRLIELSSDYIRIGRERYLGALPRYRECLKSNTWPAYDNSRIDIVYPDGFRKGAYEEQEHYEESEETWRNGKD